MVLTRPPFTLPTSVRMAPFFRCGAISRTMDSKVPTGVARTRDRHAPPHGQSHGPCGR